MAQYFLIDYENVRENGLAGADKLDAEDSIFVFYTKNANKISLDAFCNINASIKVLKVPAGKQSLDMHISSMLGYLAGKASEKSDYIIVSKDKDFDTIIASWNEAGAGNFSKRETILTDEAAPAVAAPARVSSAVCELEKADASVSETPAVKKQTRSRKPVQQKEKENREADADDRTVMNNRIVKLLRDSGVEGNLPTSVASVVMANVKKQNPKQAVYLELIKKFGQRDGLSYYKTIKSIL